MSDQFCSLVAVHYVSFLIFSGKLHGLAKETMNCVHVYLHIQFNIPLRYLPRETENLKEFM